jgi:Na+-driven multidrug efflux pump
MIYNFFSGILRSRGDTVRPLMFSMVGGVVNVFLNFIFVKFFGIGVEGVAIATIISQIISATLVIRHMCKLDDECRLDFKKLAFDASSLKQLIKIGLPAGVQGSLFSLSNMIIQSSILRMNEILCPPNSSFDPVVNGNAAATNLEGFLYTTQNSVYQAAITFTSQNAGAKKYKRIYRIMICSYIIGACVIVPFSQLTFLLRDPLLALYGVKAAAVGTLEQIAYTTAIKRMEYVFIPYIVCMFMDAGCGIVRGLGKSMSSTIISLLGACIFRVAWILLVFNNFPSLEIIYLSYPISWTITGATFLVYSLITIRKLIKKQELEQ